MKKPHSGLDAWRYLIESESERKSVESYLPLILSAAGALGVFPFMVLRYLQQEWLAAAVDTVIVSGFVSLGIYVYRTRNVRFASIVISLFCVAGVISTVYIIGPHQVYWAYPALMAVFYLLGPRESVIMAIVTVAALLPQLAGAIDTHATTTVLITITVMSAFAFAFSLITNRQRGQLVELATKDPLTGAGNRRGLDNKLTDILNNHQRNGLVASMLMIDIDHFKQVNDAHGHPVGDEILRRITEIIDLRIRVTDSIYRIGGEEFVVLVEGQDRQKSTHLAEQLRTLVDANELVPDLPVTISLGVAELKADDTADSWLHRADKALYKAKRAGRNATAVAD